MSDDQQGTVVVEELGSDPDFDPQLVEDPAIIRAHLYQLQQHRVPLLLNFSERGERFRSTLIAMRRDYDLIAVDELVPFAGAELIRGGSAFKVTGYHDGVRMTWQCVSGATPGMLDGLPCYWMAIPERMSYFQRREDFRVRVVLANLPDVGVSAYEWLDAPLSGQLLDISITGCRLGLSGDHRHLLQPGNVYQLTLRVPGKADVVLDSDVRHTQYNDTRDITISGMRFRSPGTSEQKILQQWVFQLQREAHRARSDRAL
jgi:c-di-GMP-binding flagellar brake protein YcgR